MTWGVIIRRRKRRLGPVGSQYAEGSDAPILSRDLSGALQTAASAAGLLGRQCRRCDASSIICSVLQRRRRRNNLLLHWSLLLPVLPWFFVPA